MTGYAILRAKKLKSIGAVARSARHTFREQPTLNANPAMFSRNLTQGANSAGAVVDALKQALPDKRRKDAVLCIEYLVTASPEAFKRHGGRLSDTGDGYFSDALKWLKKRHGVENVISATVHLDEATPHLVAYVVPRTQEGRLNARHFLGGPKVLRLMQDSFHAACAASRSLSRGVRGSKAKHESIGAFYADLNASPEAPELTRRDYAAAAVGIITKAWEQGAATSKKHALAAARQDKTLKASRSRAKALERMAVLLDNAQQQLEHRKILVTEREKVLKNDAKRLNDRELELRIVQNNIKSIEIENLMLKRRLEPFGNQANALFKRARLEPNAPSL